MDLNMERDPKRLINCAGQQEKQQKNLFFSRNQTSNKILKD
jgi:hypothetical protein